MCELCRAEQHPRVAHCFVCGRCIQRFDHHCVFLNNCIGAGNYLFFLLFLLYTAFLLFLTGASLIATAVKNLHRSCKLLIGAIDLSIAAIVFVFSLQHLKQALRGTTTKEQARLSRVIYEV